MMHRKPCATRTICLARSMCQIRLTVHLVAAIVLAVTGVAVVHIEGDLNGDGLINLADRPCVPTSRGPHGGPYD